MPSVARDANACMASVNVLWTPTKLPVLVVASKRWSSQTRTVPSSLPLPVARTEYWNRPDGMASRPSMRSGSSPSIPLIVAPSFICFC